jgi:type VI secretion system protein ImpK
MTAAARGFPWLPLARPLFVLAGRLHVGPAGWDAEALHARVGEALRKLEGEYARVGAPAERARTAHYVVAAVVDDLALNARSGTPAVWAKQSMISIFHRDATGGDRFFDILDRLSGDPAGNRDLLELMYAGLALGFEGRLRLRPDRAEQAALAREDLYRALRRPPPGDLSAQWRGAAIPATKRALSTGALVAAFPAIAAAVAGAYFAGAETTARRADALAAAFAAAPPQPPPSLKLTTLTITQKLQGFLAAEIRAGLVMVADDPLGTLVCIRNQGMFGSGSAEVDSRYAGLIDRIGQAAARENVGLLVVGHTDNQPISTPQFPSNVELSLARAQSVAALLGKRVDPSRIRAEGRGATQPVAANDTEIGRDANRRIDIDVIWTRGDKKP